MKKITKWPLLTEIDCRNILLANMRLYNRFQDHRKSAFSANRPARAFFGVSKYVSAFIIVGFICCLWSACRKSEQAPSVAKKIVDNRYANWKTFASQNIKVIYPEGHPQEGTFGEMAQAYQYLFRKLNETLGIPPITDTITVYYYTGYGQGRELTGQEYPFADSSGIHFWLPSFYGPTMMQYLLPRWAQDPPRHKFLKHGLISMFDLSGQKYHETTIGYKNSGYFIPLDSLSRDTSTNSTIERYQSGEAASFCAFIIGQYGPQTLKELYLCPQPFDACVRQTLMMPADTLQSLWLTYVRMNVPKDSLRDSLTQ